MDKPLSFRDKLDDSTDIDRLHQIIKRYQLVFSGSGCGFWQWNLDTGYVDWSGGFWENLGYTLAELDHVNNTDKIALLMHPDDVLKMREATLEHLHTRKPFTTSYRIRTKAGEYVWTQVRADSVPDENGRVHFISGVNFDITELKETEEALRESETRQVRILQASNDGIWEWYAGRSGFHFSNRCWEMLGYDDQDDVVTRGENRLKVWRSHLYAPDLQAFDRAFTEVADKESFDLEYRILTKQSELRWIRVRGRIDFDDAGKPIRMSGTNMDITDIKRAEERILQSKEVAEKANQAKSEFLSSMSHELRTPLNAILGYAQLFEYDDNLNPIQTENLYEIRKAGEHLLQLINDVLDLSKIESGKMIISLEPVLVARIVADCFTLLRLQADDKGIKLFSNFNGFENTYVVADNIRLKQALVNLLSNAIKYNSMGGEVEVSLKLHAGDQLRIGVRDNGYGIASHRVDEVFQPFNRLSPEYNKIEGSGVGLVITKQLVEMMKGKLHFESVEGVGTEFWIDLPLCSQWNQERTTNQPVAAADSPLELRVTQPQKILYIEDNPSNIRLLQQIFMRYPQLNLEVIDESFLGVYKARSGQPDLIILDINLPGMDGYETLSVLKHDPITAHIPVIGLSANVMPYDVVRGREAGFNEYLTKPVEINLLIAALNRLLPTK